MQWSWWLKTGKRFSDRLTIEHTEIPRKQDNTDKDIKSCVNVFYLFKRPASNKHPPPE